MSTRPFPAHMYRVPDPGDTRIADLEAENARLREHVAELQRAFDRMKTPATPKRKRKP